MYLPIGLQGFQAYQRDLPVIRISGGRSQNVVFYDEIFHCVLIHSVLSAALFYIANRNKKNHKISKEETC